MSLRTEKPSKSLIFPNRLLRFFLIIFLLFCPLFFGPAAKSAGEEAPHLNLLSPKVVPGNDLPRFKLENRRRSYLQIKLKNSTGQEIAVKFKEKQIGSFIELEPESFSNLKPGKYTLEVYDPQKGSDTQDFYWGVLTMNLNKSSYYPHESINTAIAVLDDKGMMVCNANLVLTITNARGQVVKTQTTDNKQIQVNSACQIHDFTLDPDYESLFSLDENGTYKLSLEAKTPNGSYQISDYLQINDNPDFVVERSSATRIYPPKNYPMNITIHLNRTFSGLVRETLPSSFELETDENIDQNHSINWQIEGQPGDAVNLSYRYNVPDESPNLFHLASLELISGDTLVFSEPRQWQFAVDAEVSIDANIRDATYEYGTSGNIVFTDALTGYAFFISQDVGFTGQIVYRKTVNGGASWGGAVQIGTTTTGHIWNNLSVWYDRWTPGDNTGTKIYLAAIDLNIDDISFNYLDTQNDTSRSGGWVAGLTGSRYDAGADGNVSITKASDGKIYLLGFGTFTTDAGRVIVSSNGGDSFANTNMTLTNGLDDIDYGQILAIGQSDVLLIYQDVSRDELFSKIYDSSATTWISEASIGVSIVDSATFDTPWSAALRKADNSVFLAVNDHVGGFPDANIRFYKFDDSSRSWERKTNILSERPYAVAAMPAINTSDGSIYVTYLSGTPQGEVDVFYKRTDDDGTSWTAQSVRINSTQDDYKNLGVNMQSSDILYCIWYDDDDNDLFGSQVPFIVNLDPIPDSSTFDLTTLDATDEYAASPALVYTSINNGYVFYVDAVGTSGVPVYAKTTNGGITWSSAVNLYTSAPVTTFNAATLAVWYDRWTPGDTTGTKIHVAILDDTTTHQDLYYTYLDTQNDTRPASLVMVADGATFDPSGDGAASIIKEGTGNLLITGHGNYGAVETQVIYHSDIGFSGWTNTNFSLTGGLDDNDYSQLLPVGTSAAMVIVQDITANKYYSRIYQEDTQSWTLQQDLGITVTENATYDSTWGASFNKQTGSIYLTGQNYVANATNDMFLYKYTIGTTTWSNLGNVITNNATLLQSVVLVNDNNGHLYLPYIRGTVNATTDVYFRISEDEGLTWSGEALLNTLTDDIKNLRSSLAGDQRLGVVWYNDDLNDIVTNSVGIASREQRTFRFYQNSDSIGVTTPFANLNTGITLPSAGTPFRLKLLAQSKNAQTPINSDFKLQFAQNTGNCSTSVFSDVDTSTGVIRFYDNPSLTDGDSLPYTSSDPKDGTTVVFEQTYQENNPFSNSRYPIVRERDSKWDFSLVDFAAPTNTSYCFRIVLGNGTTLNSYSYYPQITTASAQGISLTGTLYSDDNESTTIDGNSICVAVNNNFNPSNCSLTSSGSFTIDNINALSGSEQLTIFSTGSTKANLVVIGDGQNITNLKLYQNHLSLAYRIGTSISISQLSNYDKDQNSQHLLFYADTSSTHTLSWDNGVELYLPSGVIFLPNGNLTGANLEIDGVYTASPGQQINLSGSFKLDSGGVFNPSTSTLSMTASSGSVDIITQGTGSLYNLIIAASGGFPDFRIQDNLNISHDLTINSGTLDVVNGENNPITIGGSWTNNDIFYARSGQVIFNGSAASTIDSGCASVDTCSDQSFYDLILSKDSSGDTLSLLNSDLLVNHTLFLSDGTFVQGGSHLKSVGSTAVNIVDGTWSNQSTGDITLGGDVQNDGHIILNSAGSCGGNDEINILSSSGTPDWLGTGTFDLRDLRLSNQNASLTIDTFSSTNVTGNTGSWLFYPTCTTGSLVADIVNASGSPISSPSLNLSTRAFSMSYQTSTGTFGVTDQKMRVSNTTAYSSWSMTLAATGGNTSLWQSDSLYYDFNDSTSTAQDGLDADNYGGQLSLNPASGTISPQGGCPTTGLSLGSQASYQQSIIDSITLASASSSSKLGCYWDILGLGLSQSIPVEQQSGDYSINLTLTVTAN